MPDCRAHLARAACARPQARRRGGAAVRLDGAAFLWFVLLLVLLFLITRFLLQLSIRTCRAAANRRRRLAGVPCPAAAAFGGAAAQLQRRQLLGCSCSPAVRPRGRVSGRVIIACLLVAAAAARPAPAAGPSLLDGAAGRLAALCRLWVVEQRVVRLRRRLGRPGRAGR